MPKPDNTEELRKQILKAALVRSSVQRWENERRKKILRLIISIRQL